MKKISVFLAAAALAFILLINCSVNPSDGGADKNSNAATYILSGTLYCTTSRDAPPPPATGKMAYIKLVVKDGVYADEALYDTTTDFSGSTASYSISGVAAGDYSLWSFIDMNGNASSSDYFPDTGDYTLTLGKAVDLTGDKVIDVLDGEWYKTPPL